MKHHLGQYSYTVDFPPVMNGGASALATLLHRQLHQQRVSVRIITLTKAALCLGAAPPEPARLGLAGWSSSPPRLPSSYTTTTTTATAFSMHFVSSLCDEQDTNTMKHEHEHADVYVHSRKTAGGRQSLWGHSDIIVNQGRQTETIYYSLYSSLVYMGVFLADRWSAAETRT